MASSTTFNAFATNEAVRPASGSGETTHTVLESTTGRASLSLHLGSEAKIKADRIPAAGSCVAFATVDIQLTNSGEFNLFITPDAVDAAVRLRDELNKAIRYARKHAQQ